MSRTVMGLAWPAFIAACLLELVVFAVVDPHDVHWSGEPVGLSRLGVYTAGFFVFWAVSAVGCGLTALLARSAAAVNACPFPPGGRPADCGKI
jgi:hypothetical protein